MKIKMTLMLLVFLPLIGCDRYTKVQAVNLLKGQEPVSFFNGIFSLTYHENTGAMLSFGANFPDEVRLMIFTVLVGLMLVIGLLYLLIKPMNKYSFTVGLLILAGGFGNLYDRALNHGRVVDFMLLQLGPLKTGIFNVADVAIMAGVFGLLFVSTKLGKRFARSPS